MWDNKPVDQEWKNSRYRLDIENEVEQVGRDFLHDRISLQEMNEKIVSLKLQYRAI